MRVVCRNCTWLKTFLLVVTINCSFLLLKAQAPSLTARFDLPLDNNINGLWEYLPRDYSIDVNKKYPLLIYFHGYGDIGDSKDITTLSKVLKSGTAKLLSKGMFPEEFSVGGTAYRFIVLCPQIKDGFANGSSNVNPVIIDNFITYAQSVYRIDPTRIYMCGLSMGGGITWDYAASSLKSASKLAGIVVAAGASDLTTAGAANISASNLAVVATHNTVDDVISPERTRANINKIKAYLPAPKPSPLAFYWNTPNASGDDANHNVWSRTFEDILPNSSVGGNLRDSLGTNIYEWMLQNQRSANPLPVIWQSFTVKQIQTGVVLQWTTGKETDVRNFIVEKSNDGVTWSAIATLNPVNGTSLYRQYTFTDPAFNPYICYYRIGVVGIDGSFTYSSVKQVNGANVAESITIFPNPFTSYISLGLPRLLPAATVVIRLMDARGGVVKKQTHVLSSSVNLIQMEGLQTLGKGIYYLSIADEHGKIWQKKKITKL